MNSMSGEFPIPVVALGAGAHPDATAADYLQLPHEMATFAMPVCDLEADPEILAAACAVIGKLRNAMQAADHACIELAGLPREVIELLNQALGQGEVSVRVNGPSRHLHIQESVFAGIWRVQQVSAQGALLRDSLQAGDIPPAVRDAALSGAAAEIAVPPPRPGMMNALAVLNELRERSRNYRAGEPVHVVNLTLLPMSPEDLEYLSDALGRGTVEMLSRGYGNCRITGTGLANVWWVQYFNSMDHIILNTIEVVDVPEAALASAEDYRESVDRIGEWLDVMQGQ